MRATAADCLLPLSSQAIGKHLRDRAVGAGVAPEFLAKRNSQLVGIRDGAPTTPSVPSLARISGLSPPPLIRPAFVLARVCAVAELVAGSDRERSRTVALPAWRSLPLRERSSQAAGPEPADRRQAVKPLT